MTRPAWLTRALGGVGFHEKPVNVTKFGKYYKLDGQPWCATFVSWCFATTQRPLPSMQAGMPNGFAAAFAGMDYAKKHDAWRPSWEAEPGDLIIYGWDGPGSSWDRMHVGMVISSGPKGSTGRTVEGNRGDCVARHTFVVGERVVLGTIDVKKLLGIKAKPDPIPQPRNPDHPQHTGPDDDAPSVLHADLGELPPSTQASVTRCLTRHHVSVVPPKPAPSQESAWWRRLRRYVRRSKG